MKVVIIEFEWRSRSFDHESMPRCFVVMCSRGRRSVEIVSWGILRFLVSEGLLSSLLSLPCSLMRPLQAPNSPTPHTHTHTLTHSHPETTAPDKSQVWRIAVYPLCLRCPCQQRVAYLPPPTPHPPPFKRLVKCEVYFCSCVFIPILIPQLHIWEARFPWLASQIFFLSILLFPSLISSLSVTHPVSFSYPYNP